MMRMNNAMKAILAQTRWFGESLPNEFLSIANEGFMMRNECILLSALAKLDTNASLQNFPDKTGYECFINSIRIDADGESKDFIYACMLIESLMNRWRDLKYPSQLNAIVIKDEFGSLVKFHLHRKGESWLSDNLADYEEAILVMDSSPLIRE